MFSKLELLTREREKVDAAWRAEIRALAKFGVSSRGIAQHAGVSHTAVWAIVRNG